MTGFPTKSVDSPVLVERIYLGVKYHVIKRERQHPFGQEVWWDWNVVGVYDLFPDYKQRDGLPSWFGKSDTDQVAMIEARWYIDVLLAIYHSDESVHNYTGVCL